MYTIKNRGNGKELGRFLTAEEAGICLVASLARGLSGKASDYSLVEVAEDPDQIFDIEVEGLNRIKRISQTVVVTEAIIESDDVRLMPVDSEDKFSEMVPVSFGKRTDTVVMVWEYNGSWSGLPTRASFDDAPVNEEE